MRFLLFILLISFIPTAPEKAGETGTITITFTNIEVGKGLLRTAVYGENRFLKRDGELYDYKEKATSTSMTVTFEDIPYGTYAIAAYQDENEDAKLSKNAIGLPNEAYGFSKKLPSKWRVPKFDDVSFELNSSTKAFDVKLNYWKNH